MAYLIDHNHFFEIKTKHDGDYELKFDENNQKSILDFFEKAVNLGYCEYLLANKLDNKGWLTENIKKILIKKYGEELGEWL